MIDSQNTVLSNTAHDYMECSNKGICDRSTGLCTCFPGYDGSGCQRASCPTSSAGFCSGHGVCKTIKEISRDDYNNSYLLWDEESTMGCVCDPGFEGPDCSKAMCKFGADPLYYDDEVNMRYSNFTFVLYQIDLADGTDDTTIAVSPYTTTRRNRWSGNFSIVFYDIYEKDWRTDPLDIFSNCDDITKALESLPNNVIPSGSVRCSMDFANFGGYYSDNDQGIKISGVNADAFPIAINSFYSTSGSFNPYVGTKFTLAFPGNPGKLKQPYLDYYLDGSRPTVTLSSVEATTAAVGASVVRSWVYPNGFSGENFDFVPDLCQGVQVKLSLLSNNWAKLDDLTAEETKLLMRCLGDADGVSGNNNDNKKASTQDALYNWDYGFLYSSSDNSGNANAASILNPHLIKLVDTSVKTATRLCDVTTSTFTGVDEINQPGYCLNPDQPGFYAVLFYEPNAGVFKIMSPVHKDYTSTAVFNIFTTTGYLSMASTTTDVFTNYRPSSLGLNKATDDVANFAKIANDIGYMYSNVIYTTNATVGGLTNVDCETAPSSRTCLKKGDYVVVLDMEDNGPNPKYMNLYQIKKISRENREAISTLYSDPEPLRYQIVLDMGMNAQYLKEDITVDSKVRIFKFTPPSVQIDYVKQCSSRGLCDTSTGTCNCFAGYTNDDCSVQSALKA